MAKIIALVNNEISVGKSTSALNLSILLSKKKKKTLLVIIDSNFIFSYLKIQFNQIKLNAKGSIAPFVLGEYDKYFSILALKEKINQKVHDYQKLFVKQIQLVETKYDYIIVDINRNLEKLIDASLKISCKAIAVYDSHNFSSLSLQKTLNKIQKSRSINSVLKLFAIVLNNYDHIKHIASLVQINKIIGPNLLLITLPHREELLKVNQEIIKFIKHNL
jgi:cellulose biosynthesis protein BcsQ